jgi:two-component system cell cycle sensor histidine kinase/response regulator CckA
MGKLLQALRRRFSSRSNTILIAESDQMLRRLECRALSPQYRIVQTSSHEDAVRIAAKHKMELDLLLTQVRFPRMDGWDLTELLKLDYPSLEVVYVSSSIDAAVKAHTRPSTVIVLEKNRFSPGRLRQAVHDALEIRKYNRMAVKGVTDSLFTLWSRQWAKHHL